LEIFAPLLQYLISGLTNGAIYALIALGFGIIYNATTIINFAQGEMVMLGALCAISIYHLVPSLPLAFAGAVVLVTCVGLVFERLGVHWNQEGEDIVVPSNQKLRIEPDLGGAIPEISVMPWPAFPTDLMSIAIVVATQSKGTVLFHDWMYPSRMFFTDKLVGMGAQIVLCDPHRCIVQGPSHFYGEKMESPDIRAGMALLLATLSAPGKSVIRNIGQIDRGYEKVDVKLKSLGATIERVTE